MSKMVLRKPVPSQTDLRLQHSPSPSTSHLPSSQPSTSESTAAPPEKTLHSTAADQHDSDLDEDEWNKSDSDWEMEDKPSPDGLPASLRISRPSSRTSSATHSEIPSSLRIGSPAGGGAGMLKSRSNLNLNVPHGSSPRRTESSFGTSASDTPSVQLQSQNPFLRRQNTGEAIFGGSNSSSVWVAPFTSAHGTAGQPHVAELPSDRTPTDPMSKMSLNELPNGNSPSSSHPLSVNGLPALEKADVNSREPDLNTSAAWNSPAVASSLDTTPLRSNVLHDTSINGIQHSRQEEQAWEQGEEQIKASEGTLTPERTNKEEDEPLTGDELPARGTVQAAGDFQPQLPEDLPRAQGTLAQGDLPAVATSADSPSTAMTTQRNPTYQVKKIRWYDASSDKLRVTPILIQNANGPCPLLALVNALTLSTPLDAETALVETLRTREQVSLGLLIDAVFEELMSGRRGEAAQGLPDVSDLYTFLIALHTGMNVNPRFVSIPDRSSMDMHPALREQSQSGGFEATREMKLYSTFNVPLMHGWLPTRESPAYAAFERSAKTYEDAQNAQFYEEELEAKVNSTGLSAEEQLLFEDLHTIKQFLATWPTQLTEHGLDVLLQHVKPGQFAILFRNDHFSTIYKEPRTQQLLTVVTDAGYSSHEEIVWESLVDLSGQGTEFYSGDFRPVSHKTPPGAGASSLQSGSHNQRPVQSMLDVEPGWTAVQSKSKSRGKNSSSGSVGGQVSGVVGSSSSAVGDESSVVNDVSRAEQEDHDLALALQLQEEEEVRHRREQEVRRRDQELAQQVTGQRRPTAPTPAAPSVNRPLIPVRRNNGVNRPANSEDVAPPPTYEQASKDRRFVPPRDHPASPHAPVSLRQEQSAYMANPSTSSAGQRPSPHSQRGNLRQGVLIDSIPSSSMGRGSGRYNTITANGSGTTGRDQNEKCSVM